MINIVIEDNGAVSLKTTKGVVETEVAATIVVEAMRNLLKPKSENNTPAQTNYYLYLDKVEDNNKLSTVKALSQQLNIPLKRAKEIVDTSVADKHDDILLSQSSDKSYINTMKDVLESAGCICRIISGF